LFVWPKLETLVRVETEPQCGGKVAIQNRYYISTLLQRDPSSYRPQPASAGPQSKDRQQPLQAHAGSDIA
jgi:hypothetical protein